MASRTPIDRALGLFADAYLAHKACQSAFEHELVERVPRVVSAAGVRVGRLTPGHARDGTHFYVFVEAKLERVGKIAVESATLSLGLVWEGGKQAYPYAYARVVYEAEGNRRHALKHLLRGLRALESRGYAIHQSLAFTEVALADSRVDAFRESVDELVEDMRAMVQAITSLVSLTPAT